MFYLLNKVTKSKAGVKLYNIVGVTLLFSVTTSLFLLNKAKINNVLHQKCCTIWPQPNSKTLVTTTKYRFSDYMFCSRINSSLKNSTKFGDSSNYSERSGEWNYNWWSLLSNHQNLQPELWKRWTLGDRIHHFKETGILKSRNFLTGSLKIYGSRRFWRASKSTVFKKVA